MKKLVLVGAFDRYNYGDNLMPILLKMFVEQNYPEVFDKFVFIYASLSVSDLSRYGVKKTICMSDALMLEGVYGVVCVGGEVLRSSSSTLFLYMDHPEAFRKIVKLLRKTRMTFFADIFCRLFYKLPWEYPYIPDKRVNPEIKVAFNTVGGTVPMRSVSARFHGVMERLQAADYLSVRDTRTKESLERFSSPKLYPDSAMIMSDLVSEGFLQDNVSSRVKEMVRESSSYIVFQAAPHKVGARLEEVFYSLNNLKKSLGIDVILCPIGYAKGHDDREYLSDLHRLSDGGFSYIDNLSIWEIMYLIQHSSLFIGTSLHGVITALSYGVPHIGLNEKVIKLDRFLKDWSIPPLNKCYPIHDISTIGLSAVSFPRHELEKKANYLKSLVVENNNELLISLGLVK